MSFSRISKVLLALNPFCAKEIHIPYFVDLSCNKTVNGKFMRLHKYLFNKMSVHLMEQLCQRHLNDASNLIKLNTKCPPSCNYELLKEQNLHYVLGWHLLCYFSWSMHAQSMPLHNSAKARRCPSKISDAVCDCQLSLYRNDFLCM